MAEKNISISKETRGKKIRISWRNVGLEKTFLEACIHEVTHYGRQGSSLKHISWKNVAEKLKLERKFIVDQKQMKNRYDYLKGKFTAWQKLKNKTGNAYDPSTNTFNLSQEEWEIEIKSNKFVESLRTAPLCHPDLCMQLFERSTSNGFDSWGSSSTLPHPSVEVSNHNLNDFDDIECTQIEPSTQGISEESSVRSKKRGEKRKEKEKETLESKLIEVANVLIEKHRVSNNMDACFEKLETMGWEEESAKYQTALLLFGESIDLRNLWLRLKPHTCDQWVKNAGAKYGLFE